MCDVMCDVWWVTYDGFRKMVPWPESIIHVVSRKIALAESVGHALGSIGL